MRSSQHPPIRRSYRFSCRGIFWTKTTKLNKLKYVRKRRYCRRSCLPRYTTSIKKAISRRVRLNSCAPTELPTINIKTIGNSKLKAKRSPQSTSLDFRQVVSWNQVPAETPLRNAANASSISLALNKNIMNALRLSKSSTKILAKSSIWKTKISSKIITV